MAVRDLLLYWVLLFVHACYVDQLLKRTPLFKISQMGMLPTQRQQHRVFRLPSYHHLSSIPRLH